jgi:hypothetical protein
MLSAASAALANTVLPGSTQQHALAIAVEGNTIRARACRPGSACSAAGGTTYSIPADVDAGKVTVDSVELIGGKFVAHVHAPLGKKAKGGWTLVLAASDAAGAPKVERLLTGRVGVPQGLEGEQRSKVLVREKTGDGERLIVGRRFENANLCGRQSVMYAQALTPSDMTWNRTTTRTLTPAQKASATKITARYAEQPLEMWRPQLLHGVVASSAIGKSRASMTDRNLSTGWSEKAKGAGQGEFLVMTGSDDVAVTGFELVIKPSDAGEKGAAPKSFYIATRKQVFAVTMPDDAWQRDAGARYVVDLPQPMRSDCFAIVLDQGHVSAEADQVTIAELRARTRFDSSKLVDLVRALESDSDADGARALLIRSGDKGAKATIDLYTSLNLEGKRRARDVIESGGCNVVAPFFVDRVLGKGAVAGFDPDLDPSAKHARERLRLCKPQARKSLASEIRAADVGDHRVWASRELATIGPSDAVNVILEVLDQESTAPQRSGSADVIRRGLRASLSAAVQHKRARAAVEQTLAPEFFAKLSLVKRIDLLRAIGPKLASFSTSGGALGGTLESDTAFRTRFLLLEPAAHLAAGGDANAKAILRQSLRDDSNRHIRARAARVAGLVPALSSELEAALSDKAPRVREAALLAITESTKLSASAESRVAQLLQNDPWTFVRIGAATTLTLGAASPAADQALLSVLAENDGPTRLRSAALRALGKRKSVSTADDVLGIADDPTEPVHIRVAAISALGDMCYRPATEFLYKLALRAGYQQIPYDQPLGLAALSALGDIKPANLHDKLAPLFVKNKIVPPQIRSIARDVLERDGTCSK